MRASCWTSKRGIALALVAFVSRAAFADYHLIGWANTFVPGLGVTLLGRPGEGAIQAVGEVGAFVAGYSLSGGSVFSLDGFTFVPPAADPVRRQRGQVSANREITGDILQEIGIKAHMVNTFRAYREAWERENPEEVGTLAARIDPTPTLQLFLEPFRADNFSDPWVWAPLGLLFGLTAVDYYSQRSGGNLTAIRKLTPSSNMLYTFNYMALQPFGSGAPEEMFYRGFLQNEFRHASGGSPYFAIAASSALFAFSHAPEGRLSAAVAGAYLGFLAEKYDGRLGRGITLHYWSSLILGLETVLLSSAAQRTTPPGALSLQFDF